MTRQSEVAPLRRVLLKHARDAFAGEGSIHAQWEALGYLSPPDYDRACRESDALGALLEKLGVTVAWAPPGDTGLDSIYVRDAAVVSDRGTLSARMGKAARGAEPEALAVALSDLGVPALGAIEAPGCLEGGDVVWLDAHTLAVGRGYRTNQEGIRQLRAHLGPAIEVLVVPLPHWRGPDDVFHLMSMLSPLDDDLALVHSPLLPVPFRERLLEKGTRLVEVPPEEFESMGCNVLAVAPRVAVALEGNPETRRRMEAAGVEVHAYAGAEISGKGRGGPTCLARTLERVD